MNVSERFKTIWWLPERTGARMTFSILRDFGFVGVHSADEIAINEGRPDFDHTCHSISKEYIYGYQLIANVRNPYEQIYSLYYHETFDILVVKKNHTEIIKKKFAEWVKKFFVSKKLVVEPLTINVKTDGVNNFYDRQIINWVYDGKIPDKVVRIENFLDDLSKIDFIVESEEWKGGKIEELFHNNPFKNNRHHQFHDIYDFDSARKIYNYYKREFHTFGYDPFSFSKTELTNDEKMRFLHDLP